jgi:hypothetical protein
MQSFTSKFSELPPEAILATMAYFLEQADMPSLDVAREVFADVPAQWLEVPVDKVKRSFMRAREISEGFSSFDEYHDWYIGLGDVPQHGSENRWPCIEGNPEDPDGEALYDGNHRFHSYVRDGHDTIPIVRWDMEAWWQAHDKWLKSEDEPSLKAPKP